MDGVWKKRVVCTYPGYAHSETRCNVGYFGIAWSNVLVWRMSRCFTSRSCLWKSRKDFGLISEGRPRHSSADFATEHTSCLYQLFLHEGKSVGHCGRIVPLVRVKMMCLSMVVVVQPGIELPDFRSFNTPPSSPQKKRSIKYPRVTSNRV